MFFRDADWASLEVFLKPRHVNIRGFLELDLMSVAWIQKYVRNNIIA